MREIEELLSLRTNPSADRSDVRERAVAKLEEVDQKMEQLGRIRSALDELIAVCLGRGALRTCSIMEFLVAPTEGTSVNASADGKENERLQNF